VPSDLPDRLDDVLPHLLGESLQLVFLERMKVLRPADALQEV
jgi:hypothetical protein